VTSQQDQDYGSSEPGDGTGEADDSTTVGTASRAARVPGDDDLMEPGGDLAEPGEPFDPDAEGSPEPGDADVVIVPEVVDDPPTRYASADTGPAANAGQTTSNLSAGSGLGRVGTTSAHEADPVGSLDLTQQWHDIQAGFVDDPRGAVRLAAQAAEDALGVLIASLRERQSALAPVIADSSGDQDTEWLRGALRDYRVLCQNAEEIGRQITHL
jgi:hypothetical protein